MTIGYGSSVRYSVGMSAIRWWYDRESFVVGLERPHKFSAEFVEFRCRINDFAGCDSLRHTNFRLRQIEAPGAGAGLAGLACAVFFIICVQCNLILARFGPLRVYPTIVTDPFPKSRVVARSAASTNLVNFSLD